MVRSFVLIISVVFLFIIGLLLVVIFQSNQSYIESENLTSQIEEKEQVDNESEPDYPSTEPVQAPSPSGNTGDSSQQGLTNRQPDNSDEIQENEPVGINESEENNNQDKDIREIREQTLEILNGITD